MTVPTISRQFGGYEPRVRRISSKKWELHYHYDMPDGSISACMFSYWPTWRAAMIELGEVYRGNRSTTDQR